MKKIFLIILSLFLFNFVEAQSLPTPTIIGKGAYSGAWPSKDWGLASHLRVLRSTATVRETANFPVLFILDYGAGTCGSSPSDEPNSAAIAIYSNRVNSMSTGISVAVIPGSSGYQAEGVASHVLMDKGTQNKYSSGFSLWLSGQVWNHFDSYSNEINFGNFTYADTGYEGEYKLPKLINGLALIATGRMSSSSALYIGSQNLPDAAIQRGIDFQQGSIKYYPIVLPNGKGIFSRNSTDTKKANLISYSPWEAVMVGQGQGWIDIGNNAPQDNPVYMRVNGKNAQNITVGPPDSCGMGFRCLRILN